MLIINEMQLQKHQLRGPVGYTVVGSPTIVEGVLTDCGADNYLQTTQPFSPLDKTWEAVFDITTGSDVTSEQYFFSSQEGDSYEKRYGMRLGIQNGTFIFTPGTGGFGYLLTGGTVTANTHYVVRFGRNTTGRHIDLYENGVWNTLASDTNTQSSVALANTRLCGYTGYVSNWFPFKGALNLNSTYIKVDGKLWFWQPQETKRIVVNGVEVWRKAQ